MEKIGNFDVAIIGGGPGGYVAAIRAGQLGLKAALIEKDPQPGGTCTHRGCIPTKALLHTAYVLDAAREGATIGVRTGDVSVDLPAAMRYKQDIVTKNTRGLESLLTKNKVQTINGIGRLESPTVVAVRGAGGKEQSLEAKNIILATGSVPARLPFLDFKNPRIITSDEALKLDAIPRHVTVLGAGAVGVEFASIFKSFGAEVLIVEMLDRLLPNEDHEVSQELQRAFRRRKIEFKVSTRLEKAAAKGNGLEILLTPKDGEAETVSTDLLLCAVGRKPYTEGLNAEKQGVILDKGFVKIDRKQRTARPNIYAIGDIVPDTPLLAHAASAEGIVAVEVIAGKKPQPVVPHLIPSATYCHPEVASVGLTEKKAIEEGHRVKTSKFPMTALGKARIIGATYGFFKIVADEEYGEILGVHIIGPHATDLISEACVAIGMEATAADLAHIVHPHPTLSEGMAEAAHGLVGGAIHI